MPPTQLCRPERRIVAIRALRGGSFATVSPALRGILESHPAPEVEAAAVGSLAAFDEPAAAQTILDHWRGYSPAARKRAVDALVDAAQSHSDAAQSGGGRTGGASAIDPAGKSRLYDDPDPAISEARQDAARKTATRDRAKVVASYHDAVTLAGEATHGKKVFDDNCARCHMPRKQGGRVGPDLSGINNKTKEELLTSILNPSYAIEPRFVNYVITTKDGRMYDGVIADETPGSITLRGGSDDGLDETILRKNITEVRASSVSLMPEGFEKDLSKKDVADVIAYLRGGL